MHLRNVTSILIRNVIPVSMMEGLMDCFSAQRRTTNTNHNDVLINSGQFFRYFEIGLDILIREVEKAKRGIIIFTFGIHLRDDLCYLILIIKDFALAQAMLGADLLRKDVFIIYFQFLLVHASEVKFLPILA